MNDATKTDMLSLCEEKRDGEVKAAAAAGRDEKGRVKARQGRGGGGRSE